MGDSKFLGSERGWTLWKYLVIERIVGKKYIGGLNVRLGISYFTKGNVQMSKEHRRDGELELMRKRHIEKLQGCGRDGMDEVNGTGCR